MHVRTKSIINYLYIILDYYFTPTTIRTFENFKERNPPTRGSPLPIFKKSSGGLNPVASQDSLSKADLSHDKVVSNQDSNILAQKTDLLDKLRSLTGGQMVAVTLDRSDKINFFLFNPIIQGGGRILLPPLSENCNYNS